jgi:WhiB family redox-sensing transcriptional regulator
MPTDWFDQAACRGHSDIFLAGSGSHVALRRYRLSKYDEQIDRLSKAICATCPVIDDCLDWALRERIQFYVYGGLSWPERQDLLSHRWSKRKPKPSLIDGTPQAMLG